MKHLRQPGHLSMMGFFARIVNKAVKYYCKKALSDVLRQKCRYLEYFWSMPSPNVAMYGHFSCSDMLDRVLNMFNL